MATYTITLNERSASGKALVSYLKELGVLIQKITPKAKSSYQRSQEDKQAGRIEKFSSSEEMFNSLGIRQLERDGMLPQTYRPHKLSGQYAGSWECHLKGDWLLVWEQNDTEFTLLFTGSGTHSDLF